MVYDAVSILKSGDVYIYIVIFTKNNITFHLLSEIMNNITCCDISVKQESADSKVAQVVLLYCSGLLS